MWAAGQLALGAFANAGQICVSIERAYLHESVADAVLDALADLARGLRMGDPFDPATDLGPMVGERQVGHVDALVQDAVP